MPWSRQHLRYICIMKSTFESYGKSPFRSIKHSTYFDTYDRLFGPFVGQPITFVEIGVLGGGSLFMWRDFFGEQARIIGIDLNPSAKKWEEFGFEIYVGDQADPAFWKEFFQNVGMVDVLLDDGGHTYQQQAVTFSSSVESIRDGGVLVVEDTHTSYMRGFGPKSMTFVDLALDIVHANNHRFSSLNSKQVDSRTWSVQFFESFVAFHVDRAKSSLNSQPTDNGGEHDRALDFRHAAIRELTSFDRAIERLGLGESKHLLYILGALRARLVSMFADKSALSRVFRENRNFKSGN